MGKAARIAAHPLHRYLSQGMAPVQQVCVPQVFKPQKACDGWSSSCIHSSSQREQACKQTAPLSAHTTAKADAGRDWHMIQHPFLQVASLRPLVHPMSSRQILPSHAFLLPSTALRHQATLFMVGNVSYPPPPCNLPPPPPGRPSLPCFSS